MKIFDGQHSMIVFIEIPYLALSKKTANDKSFLAFGVKFIKILFFSYQGDFVLYLGNI